jgi:hypothetical protein
VDLSPAGSGRLLIALAAFAVLGVLTWQTMEPGKYRSLTWILLGFFALRTVLGWLRSRKMGYEEPVRNRDRLDV